MAAVSGASSGGSSGGVRAGAAYVELFLEDNAFRRALQKNQERMSKAAGMLAKAGAVTIGAGAGLAAPILGALKETMDHVGEVGSLANKLDTPIEKLSALAYAGQTAGMSIEDLAGHFENLQERIAQAAQGTGSADAVRAFSQMGIDPKQLAQMDRTEQMVRVMEGLGNIQNRTQALGMASALGGDKLQEVLKMPKDIRGAMAEASEVGAVYTKEQLAQTREINRAYLQMSSVLKGVMIEVGSAVLGESGTIKRLSAVVVANARTVTGWVREHRQVVLVALMVAGGLIAAGSAMVALGLAAKLLAMGIGGVSAAFAVAKVVVGLFTAVLTTPLGIVALLIAAFFTLTKTGREMGGELIGTAKDIGKTFGDTFGGIIDSLKSGDLGLAVEIGGAGMLVAWKQTMLGLTKSWITFRDKIETESKALALLRLTTPEGRSDFGSGLKLMLNDFGAWGAKKLVGLGFAGSAEGVDVLRAKRKGEIVDEASRRRAELDAGKLKAIADAEAELAESRRKLDELLARAAAPKAAKLADGDHGPAGPGFQFGPAIKAIGAFQSQDFSRIFSGGSIADRQLRELQKNNALQKDAVRLAEEANKLMRDVVAGLPRFS